MNIIVSFDGQVVSTKHIFQVARVIRDAIDLIRTKYPDTPKMFVTLDDEKCNHAYEYTGIMMHGSAHIQCRKCHSTTYVHQRKNNEIGQAGNFEGG